MSTSTNVQATFDYYAVILDESGSMFDFKRDTLGSLYQFFSEQRKVSTTDSPFIVTTFNSTTELRFKGTLADDLSFKYSPSGNTALYDAIGTTIMEVLNSLNKMDRKPNDIYIIILTDGHENSSQKYNCLTVKDLIEKQKANDWKFVFIGANQDALKTGGAIGVNLDSCLNYAQNAYATQQAMYAVSRGIYRQKQSRASGVKFNPNERYASSGGFS